MKDPVASSTTRKRRRAPPTLQVHVPDGIVMEILSRLPAKDVLRYRGVCRRWKDLTSTYSFAKMHMQHSIPMLLLQTKSEGFLIDRWEATRKRVKIHKVRSKASAESVVRNTPWYWYYPNFSSDGFIILRHWDKSSRNFLILNPITKEEVRIIQEPGYWDDICGMFYHPSLKQYCILWQQEPEPPPTSARLKMLNLGPKPVWRDVKVSARSLQYKFWIRDRNPVIADDVVYWMADEGYKCKFLCDESIITFDIKREELSAMRHPGSKCKTQSDPFSMSLLKVDGALAFVQCAPGTNSVLIQIWILKDREHWFWVRSHMINIESGFILGSRIVKPIAIANGELLLKSAYEGLFACNLKQCTTRNVGGNYHGKCLMLAHVPNLVSLNNCKFEIWVKNGSPAALWRNCSRST